jgi:hypothetical protein
MNSSKLIPYCPWLLCLFYWTLLQILFTNILSCCLCFPLLYFVRFITWDSFHGYSLFVLRRCCRPRLRWRRWNGRGRKIWRRRSPPFGTIFFDLQDFISWYWTFWWEGAFADFLGTEEFNIISHLMFGYKSISVVKYYSLLPYFFDLGSTGCYCFLLSAFAFLFFISFVCSLCCFEISIFLSSLDFYTN